MFETQPPSGGCVLKPDLLETLKQIDSAQPPSGGCVLKPSRHIGKNRRMSQPPSGGCVLKQAVRRLRPA